MSRHLDRRQKIARYGLLRGSLFKWPPGPFSSCRYHEWLQQLPEGTPTTATARGAIDRFTIWPTVRLTTPEVAI